MNQNLSFSKLNKESKLNFVVENFLSNSDDQKKLIESFWHKDDSFQKVFDEFSENTLSNFLLPFGVLPKIQINNKDYCVPMVIEESSVVAAASKSAKFWNTRGGFNSKVISTLKIGHVHFFWTGSFIKLKEFFKVNKSAMINSIAELQTNMKSRGGGLVDIDILDKSDLEPNFYQLEVKFETCDAMGANFINSILERLAVTLEHLVGEEGSFSESEKNIEVVMSILSNFTPECLVHTYVQCPIKDLFKDKSFEDNLAFAQRFKRAVTISKVDTYRATTHNKGIFNGIDAVVLATGNDFRAVEACGHAYAAKDGVYRGLTDCSLEDNIFTFSITLPLSIGTVGGLTSLHPLAKLSLEILDNPSAGDLMQIISSVGLAQNFAALKSLVTTGIQKGHMKMHLMNILNHLSATEQERALVCEEFKERAITFNEVETFINSIRNLQ